MRKRKTNQIQRMKKLKIPSQKPTRKQIWMILGIIQAKKRNKRMLAQTRKMNNNKRPSLSVKVDNRFNASTLLCSITLDETNCSSK